jgi:hypothetical protein
MELKSRNPRWGRRGETGNGKDSSVGRAAKSWSDRAIQLGRRCGLRNLATRIWIRRRGRPPHFRKNGFDPEGDADADQQATFRGVWGDMLAGSSSRPPAPMACPENGWFFKAPQLPRVLERGRSCKGVNATAVSAASEGVAAWMPDPAGMLLGGVIRFPAGVRVSHLSSAATKLACPRD